MLKMDRKVFDDKTAFVFRRVYEDAPEIQAVLMEEDAVEAVALLIRDFSDFTISNLFRKLTPDDRRRIFVELFLRYESEMPELRQIRCQECESLRRMA